MITATRLTIYLLISVFAACLYSCSRKPRKEIIFEKDGVKFTCPANWKISDQEQIDETTYYLCCEKRGLDESGIFTMVWFTDSIDLEALLQVYKDEMEGNTIYKYSSLEFGPNIPGTYNQYETLSCEYTCRILTLPHQGVLHSFYACSKTFYIMIQEAKEDKKKNAPGFDLLENSFSCE